MDKEKVIKGLEQFKSDFKPFCGNIADWKRVDDALALLKEQEPIGRCKDCRYWQDNDPAHTYECRWGHDETPDPDDYCSFFVWVVEKNE